MFWKDYDGWELKGARKREMRCAHCSNTTAHVVYVVPDGLQMGFIFMKKPLLGRRKYYLACPTCGFLARELSKAQARAMGGR